MSVFHIWMGRRSQHSQSNSSISHVVEQKIDQNRSEDAPFLQVLQSMNACRKKTSVLPPHNTSNHSPVLNVSYMLLLYRTLLNKVLRKIISSSIHNITNIGGSVEEDIFIANLERPHLKPQRR